jgi:hypothetical protein
MSKYDIDFVLWAEHQAALLRRVATGERINDQVDWTNVIEEIESLSRSDRRELRNRVRTILQHLLLLQASPAPGPRAGWKVTVNEQRYQLLTILDDSPSLRPGVAAVITEEMPKARRQVALALEEHLR